MLVGSDLTVRRGAITALDGVSLRLQAGQVSGVLGPNGAGKSTLLEALSGELKTARGQVMLHGRALEGWSDRERARCLAVLPQSSTLSFAFQVEDVVAMGRLPHCSGRQADARIVAAALQAADAQHLAGRSYLRLSGGERQRVHLARVLAQLWPGDEGSVLLLDEPTSAMDNTGEERLKQRLAAISKNKTLLLVTHRASMLSLVERLVIVDRGRIIADGPKESVMEALKKGQISVS